MTTASPTPLPASSFPNTRSRHAAIRTFPRSQPAARPAFRRQSPLDSFSHGQGFSADAPMIQDISIADSSDDDDIPQPMNFSALTRAILEDRSSAKPSSPKPSVAESGGHGQSRTQEPKHSNSANATPSSAALRISRKSPPPSLNAANGNPSPPRVVHLSGSRNSNGLHRSLSSSEARSAPAEPAGAGPPAPRDNQPLELITPAPAPRNRPVLRDRANSPASTARSSAHSHSATSKSAGSEGQQSQDQVASVQDEPADQAELSPQDDASKSKSRPNGEGMPGSTRLKRVPLGSGTFLRGAPMRRPLRRHHSEEDASPGRDGGFIKHDADDGSQDQHRHQQQQDPQPPSRQNSLRKRTPAQVAVQDFAQSPAINQPPIRPGSRNSHHKQQQSSGEVIQSSDLRSRSQSGSASNSQAAAVAEKGEFKISAPPLLPSALDQENEPPPTFKRNKQAVQATLGSRDKATTQSDPKDSKMLVETPAIRSPKRQALAPKNVNTPQTAPPPPPKMSVLETATATAGASTVKSKKKRTQITINGKTFYLRGRIGRGGSSDVYRVMTDNDKIFALKKVNLEDCNEDTVRGYKGEIDLLKQLENVDRVVRLFDWEVNEEKQSLSVLMEAGESDLNRILAGRLQPENATLDMAFIRHYWAEMLHCVAAVHAHDIVHSDLKPANFLLVQGRLKLIDFGIANAIDTENTVNVHRENNVGTPNYMSPESLQDTNANAERVKSNGGQQAPKLMKLGKPSDVWSLGCILYQMTYGKPPFAHIANQWNRVLAITNPSVAINYPATGIGDVSVPSSLRHTLESCLNRDPSQRPSVGQLLSERDAFLNPDAQIERWDAEGAVPVTENILEQIIGKIVERCRDSSRGLPTEDERRVYSKAFLDRVKALQRA